MAQDSPKSERPSLGSGPRPKHGILTLVGLVVLIVVIFVVKNGGLPSFDLNPGLHARFGNYGGGPRGQEKPVPFDPQGTEWGMRWYPTHVNFGPDNDTLLVSLCHVKQNDFCRIGKYSISRNHWDILPYEENRTYLTPIFSPDGKWIVFTTAPCDAQAKCSPLNAVLAKMPPDGSHMEVVADTVALSPSFSANGEKLIYWHVKKFPARNGYPADLSIGREVYMMDWPSGKETALTHLLMWGQQRGQPFLSPDGKHFYFSVFFGDLILRTDNDPPIKWADRLNFVGSTDDIPVTRENYTEKLQPAYTGDIVDMDRQGRVLYYNDVGRLKKKGDPVALAMRPANPNYKYDPAKSFEEEKRIQNATHLGDKEYSRGDGAVYFLNKTLRGKSYQKGEGLALFLRKPESSTPIEGGFDIALGFSSASLSPDSQRLAFVGGGEVPSPSPASSIGLIAQGQKLKDLIFIQWPRFELHPTPVSAKPD